MPSFTQARYPDCDRRFRDGLSFIDVVKIDRSFISGVLTDPHDETIAETIISISERFGFESLAEGAEKVEEIEWLRKRSCRFVQGYAICHPLPLEEFKSWLAARATGEPVVKQ
jgi:EAL domain-containing protein (putative c-di-GMP-specific phosphodiesterase class I)